MKGESAMNGFWTGFFLALVLVSFFFGIVELIKSHKES